MSKIQIKDALKSAVESASDGAQTVIYTDSGQSCIMNVINKFTLESVGLGKGTHPAFIVNGKEIDKIYIGTYKSRLMNNELLSLANAQFTTGVGVSDATKYAKNNGLGWHAMTGAEWSAVIALCTKNNFFPTGNTKAGKSATDGTSGRLVAAGSTNTLNGTGALSWRHDNAYNGISDLVGGAWENVNGVRLMGNEIQVIPNNDAADLNHDLSETSNLWKAIDAISGDYITPTFTGSIRDGNYQPTTQYSIRYGTTGDSNTKIYTASINSYSSLTKTSNSLISDAAILKLKQLGLFKINPKLEINDAVFLESKTDGIMRRGGHNGSSVYAGLQMMDFGGVRGPTDGTNTCRICYYDVSK